MAINASQSTGTTNDPQALGANTLVPQTSGLQNSASTVSPDSVNPQTIGSGEVSNLTVEEQCSGTTCEYREYNSQPASSISSAVIGLQIVLVISALVVSIWAFKKLFGGAVTEVLHEEEKTIEAAKAEVQKPESNQTKKKPVKKTNKKKHTRPAKKRKK
jgi:hypothetical protein